MTIDDVVVDVSRDWVLACDVQQRFMQGLGRTSDSVDRSAQCRQVRALGGDCYDFVLLTDHRLGLVVGDASGKGVAAALMIASVQSALRAAAFFTGNDPAALLKIVNLRAYASSLADRYATVFYDVFYRSTRMLRCGSERGFDCTVEPATYLRARPSRSPETQCLGFGP